MTQSTDKIMAMLGGQSSAEYTRSQLTEQDRIQINNAIDVLFSGLSLRNWLGGGTLGNSWAQALDSVREFVFSFPGNNPAIIYAHQATFDHRKKWQTKIVMSQDGDEKIHCTDVQCAELGADAQNKIQNGVAMLRAKIAEFDAPNAPRTNATTPKQNVPTRDYCQVREREHEHERERSK